MREHTGLYTILSADRMPELNFDAFVESKETVRFNRDRSQFIVQYTTAYDFVPNSPILSHDAVVAKLRNAPLWKKR